jgi:hypothetical protein
LAQQIGKHRRIPGVAAGDLNRSDFQRLFVNTPLGILLCMTLPCRGCGSCAKRGGWGRRACRHSIRFNPRL